jgi:hypothetical protein
MGVSLLTTTLEVQQMKDAIDLGGRPSNKELRQYSESHAYRLMRSRGFDPNQRDITAAFMPTAASNLEAVEEWIFGLVSGLDYKRIRRVDMDLVIPRHLELGFDQRVEDVFALDIFD